MNDFSKIIQTLPKVELHLHLDCSLSFEIVQKLLPGTTLDEYNEKFIAPEHCGNLLEYIKCAAASIDIMQTREQLRLVTLDLFEQFKKDHVVYAEIRFAPLQHLKEGLTAQQVVEAVNDAIIEGTKKTGIEARMILCSLRNFTEEQSLETVQLVKQFSGTMVTGFDLAADEAGFPIDEHVKAFEFAKANDIPCTCHAGEACGPESVYEAVDQLHAQRIGHGVRSYEDQNLMDYLIEKDIHLELCLTSNVKTGVFDRKADHDIDRIYNTGISMSVNTDGRALSNVSLSEEYESIRTLFNWKLNDYLKVNLMAIDAAFASDETKDRIKQKLISSYTEISE